MPPARRRTRARRARPALTQSQLDLLGLGLIALGVYFAFVIHLGWEGGAAGEAIAGALEWLLGAVRGAVPLVLLGAGAICVLRPVLAALAPFRSGAVCLLTALSLGLAAGTIGPGGERPGFFVAEWVRPRGGMLGDALDWAVAGLLGSFGAHLVAAFLFLAGLLLVTGASVAGVITATSARVTTTTRRIRTAELPRRRRVAMLPPEPADEEPQVHRPVREPAWDEPGDDEQDAPAPAGDGFDDDDEHDATTLADEPCLAEDPPEDEPGVMRRRLPVAVGPDDLTPQGRLRASVTDHPEFPWELPDPALLTRSTPENARPDTAGMEEVASQLVEALGHFGVSAQVTGMVAGPHITRYELRLAPGIKVGKVAQLKDDLAYALAATDVRILAPIPGKQAVGVEVPNARRRIVHLGDVLAEPGEGWSPLTVWLGKDVAGRGIAADLAKMPHLLVAGTTGAGKSGCVNAMLSSILLRATPHEVRLVLVDPKQVELNHYDSIPHLLTPVITSPRMAANALQNLVREMEQRYGLMSLARTRSLGELNRAREARGEPPLPYILCVIDELADLMMVAPADVEDSIIRLAQKARAVGIHLVLATQSPRVDVITGMIKANVPSRIAFAVSSQTDSRVILDQNGAEALLGQGDMLFSPVGSSRLQRIQGAYIDEGQIAALTEVWRRQGEPDLREELLEEVPDAAGDVPGGGSEDGFDPDEDPLLDDAIRLVAEMQTASTSMLQRRLRLGYTRAGRLIDMLERRGVISGYEGSKPRQVLITQADLPRVLAPAGAAGPHDEGPGEDGPVPD